MATMLYHRTEAPTIFTEDEAAAKLAEGWADTPAAFYEKPQLVGDGETDNAPILEGLMAEMAEPVPEVVDPPKRKGWPKGKPRSRKAAA